MVDRQDIDALLVGALYGELTPADEARLTAHLESHPADRSALDALTETRATFRASGFSTFQLDPPQAISAILLQEAARRAPKPVRIAPDGSEPGWFMRFVRSFAAHPAMAAATMLVLVAGVGGLIYSRQGNSQFAEQTASLHTESIAAPTPPAGATASAGSGSAAVVAAPERTKLDDNQEAVRVDLADGEKLEAGKDKAKAAKDEGESKGGAKATEYRSNVDTANHNGIVVNGKSPTMPKDLDEDQRDAKEQSVQGQNFAKKAPATNDPAASDAYKSGLAPGGNYGSGGASPPAQAVNKVTANNTPAPDAKPATPPPPPPKTAPAPTPNLLAWAKDQHQRAISLVNDNNCRDAAAIAADIAARANDYYNQYVANDRALKPCVAYINDAREKDAEKTNKARAQKRVDVNEPSPAPTNMR